jgi:hypothetical protein
MPNETERKCLAAALARARGKCGPLLADADGQCGPRRFKYASLSAILRLAAPLLAEEGIFLTASAHREAGDVIVTWKAMLGTESIVNTCPVPLPADATAQEAGRVLTYGRRYGLAMLLGLAQDDDDEDAPSAARDEAAETAASDERTALLCQARNLYPQLSEADRKTATRRIASARSAQAIRSVCLWMEARLPEAGR